MQKLILTTLLPLSALLASCGGPSTPSAVGSSVSTGAQSGAVRDAGSQTMSIEEAQILSALNAARAVARTCGGQRFEAAAPVTWNGYLAAAARAHAADMAKRHFFDHVTPDGVKPAQRMEAAGYTDWTKAAENIAAGFVVSNVMQGWIDSPSHCKTLMDPALKEVGIGYTYQPGSPYGTYWVQDFGTR
ncbi:CAP domain-containing protein [Deinococcus sedimenti]|uniref:SCP domain-containing protein n=1 Tax=Deinococcus sedimenti TaxID=1867090 RepID=A0ABQ2S5E9_9DEIO|nr:CAP domain-containing protein [Deinococcus sedimenti]GGR90108.1 hypothetical protein GCM10008960_16510 [Deinococcus sedimenti]